MRILRLRFRNLNSLAGEWDIDFTHPDYVTSGIFAITGPTGAGKTTILDAVCVALYGQTPRLSKITQSENEIMSRQTGECFAEVEFETAKGRFRCHWSQHRSRKQADGQLQAPRHEIAEAGSGLILESKLKAVAGKVEEVTGMDFDRFTRSMLLAQGGFAVFLQAAPDKRAPILEQITGTGIYSQISIKVHECTAEQRKKLEMVRQELEGMQFLAPEEVEALRGELAEKQLEEKSLRGSLAGIREAQVWKERIALLEDEIAQLETARLFFEEQKNAAVPELERLAQAERALTLEGDYASVAAVRNQQQDEQAGLASVEKLRPKARQDLESAVDALAQAELACKNARDEQLREAELIRQTRALDVKLEEANSRLLGLGKDLEAAQRQCGEHRAAIGKYDVELQTTAALHDGNEAFLRENRVDAGLAEALTGMEQQLKAMQALKLQCIDRGKKLELQVSLRNGAEQALQRANTEWERASLGAAEAGTRLGEIKAELDALLEGREMSSWREEAELLSTRQNRLQNLHDALTRIGETRHRLDGIRNNQDTLEQKRQGLVRQEAELVRECGLREDVIRQLQEKVLLLNRVRDLEGERAHLVDGAPCPLCGALEHPYAAGNVPQAEDAQLELEQVRTAHKEAGERLSSLRLELFGVSKEIEQAKREQLEGRERLDLDEAHCAAGFAELAVTAATIGREAVIAKELDSCRAALAHCRDVIRNAEGKELELSRANISLDTAREALNRHDKARHAAELGRQTAAGEQERLKLESEALLEDLERALAEAERTFEPYGCKDLTPDNAGNILAALTRRRNEYAQRLKEREKLEKSIAGLEGKKGQEQALLGAAEKNHLETGNRLAELEKLRDHLAGQRRELFGDRDPDLEERRLAAAVSQTAARREEALREQTRLQNELNSLEQRLINLNISITGRMEQLLQLEAALSLRLNETGFAGEAAFLQARLPQGRLEELSRLAGELRRKELEIQARRGDRTAALQQELAKNLSAETLEQIREDFSTTTAQLSELQKTAGGIEQKLRQHDEQQRRQQDRLRAMELQKLECARWERLHGLIGSSDGKKFRNFAQGLTFELMIAHANRQLQKMSDRYILVRDNAEPLELNVIDNYQAGEVRSTKNLSGGESFIASLALSLGLSSMASRNVRVDSLFLDEGFGTLDEDALETALETLSGLQQDGKLIGVISHVPALKERIGTQIQVDAGSAGRSCLSGPGCRRVA